MVPDREQLVRDRAHAIWEAEGCPDGRDADHWRQAQLELADVATQAAVVDDDPGADVPASVATPSDKPPVRKPSVRKAAPGPASGEAGSPGRKRRPKA